MVPTTNWMPQLRATTRQQDRERAYQQELEERVRSFLLTLDQAVDSVLVEGAQEFRDMKASISSALAQAAEVGISSEQAQRFVRTTTAGFASWIRGLTRGEEGEFDSFVGRLLVLVKDLEISPDDFRTIQQALATAVILGVTDLLHRSLTLRPDTLRILLHVAIQSLRAALAKPG
jgi:hypothetical protein